MNYIEIPLSALKLLPLTNRHS